MERSRDLGVLQGVGKLGMEYLKWLSVTTVVHIDLIQRVTKRWIL